MKEKEYLINIFKEHFSSFDKEKIALYGLGSYTEIIIDSFSDYKICGLLDGFEDSGTLYGKQIISLQKLIEMQIKVIIIVARLASVKIIYRRISKFCEINGIKVYDLTGKELSKKEKQGSQNFIKYSICEEDVKNIINEYDCVSFDIFNTLLARKVSHPYDVFLLLERRFEYFGVNFSKERIIAENQLAKNNPTLKEIYAKIISNTGISEAIATQFMQAEINLEKNILVVRKSVSNLYNYAISIGKKVSLISDMYLSKEVISEILKKNKINAYHNIFISNEYGTSKKQDLYRLYKENVKGNKYLHIGDDKDADGIFAKLNGIKDVIIDSPIEMIGNSTYKDLNLELENLEKKICIGLISEKLFNNPFSLSNKGSRPTIKNSYELGYVLIGPMMVNYMIWLINNLKDKNYNKILFISRDGYLIKKLYDKIINVIKDKEKLPKSIYFLSSRHSGIASTIKSNEDIVYASRFSFDGKPEDLLRKRFFLREKEIEPYDEMKYLSKDEYFINHRQHILSYSNELRKNYKKYIKTLNINKTDKIAIFDFVSTGTCQMAIEEILEHKLDGYYFMKIKENFHKKEKLSIVSYYDNEEIFDKRNNLSENYFFIENIIKERKSSILCFDKYGKPIYKNENRSREQLKNIRDAQNGVLDFLTEYLSIMDFSNLNFERDLSDKIFGFIKSNYSILEIENMFNYVVKDEFCNRNINVNI